MQKAKSMKTTLRSLLKKSVSSFGYEIRKVAVSSGYEPPVEFSERDREILDYVFSNDLTMVSPQRLCATIQAAKYVVHSDVPGDFVECGVWRGGNGLAAKMVFEALNSDRRVILFDTFAGMTEPTDLDVERATREHAGALYRASQKDDHNDWCFASLEHVRNNFMRAGVSMDGVSFIKGDVCQTLEDAANLPARIAVLRLDTDWYESTAKELDVLYPRLAKRGALIIDDYGYWEGARKAVDEYLERMAPSDRPLLAYTDVTGRMAIKP